MEKTNAELQQRKYDEHNLELAIQFAENNPHFDSGFIDSLQVQYAEKKYLSPGQSVALVNIIKKWHMITWAEKADLL